MFPSLPCLTTGSVLYADYMRLIRRLDWVYALDANYLRL